MYTQYPKTVGYFIIIFLLAALVGCSKYSSYDDCYEKNMSKMDEDLKLVIHEHENFISAVEGLCEEYKD